mmetsp:Transcript_16349/g.43686  ORF Transcript_16349/g.43686 Transcript_16349/m.43686 type:complete len:262 (-) Transcript_16349:851-1636(-)
MHQTNHAITTVTKPTEPNIRRTAFSPIVSSRIRNRAMISSSSFITLCPPVRKDFMPTSELIFIFEIDFLHFSPKPASWLLSARHLSTLDSPGCTSAQNPTTSFAQCFRVLKFRVALLLSARQTFKTSSLHSPLRTEPTFCRRHSCQRAPPGAVLGHSSRRSSMQAVCILGTARRSALCICITLSTALLQSVSWMSSTLSVTQSIQVPALLAPWSALHFFSSVRRVRSLLHIFLTSGLNRSELALLSCSPSSASRHATSISS